MNDNFTKSNLLITFNYPKTVDDAVKIDIENEVRAEIFAIMTKYKVQEKIEGFVIADDEVISEKIKDSEEC